jgi:hypothetical protein
MNQTAMSFKSFMGGAEYIDPTTDLDKYLADMIKNGNKGHQEKLKIQQKKLIESTKKHF